VALIRLEDLEDQAILGFLESTRPYSYRIGGEIAESGGDVQIFVDSAKSPSLCVLAGGGWLATLGSKETVLAHLPDLGQMAARMETAGEKPYHPNAQDESGVMRLSALPTEVREAVISKRPLIRETACGLYTVAQDEFTPVNDGPPIDQIRANEISLVSSLGQHGDRDAYIAERIARAPHVAVRVGDELAAYMIVHANGSIGMLHTIEKFRNRKLGRAAASALAAMQMAREMPVYCYIIDGNMPSQRVFTSLGFRRVADVSWSVFGKGN